MAQVPYTAFYNGPFAVYPSPSGMSDAITGLPYLGGSLHEGDYADLTESEAQQWSVQFGTQLHAGRYRFVRLSARSTTSNTGFGKPVAWGLGTRVAQVALAAGGSGATTDGTYTITSTAAGGTAAQALATVSGGVITAVQLTYPGANFTSVPTFGLTEIAGISGASVLAQQEASPNFISTFDSAASELSDVRGILLTTVTAAQITAGAWVVIQEEGIAPVLVTTATNTAAGTALAATTGAVVTSTTPATAVPVGFFGYALDLTAASTLVRAILRVPVQQG